MRFIKKLKGWNELKMLIDQTTHIQEVLVRQSSYQRGVKAAKKASEEANAEEKEHGRAIASFAEAGAAASAAGGAACVAANKGAGFILSMFRR